MVKLGAKSPYITSLPNSSRCSTCYKPIPIDTCPLLPKNTNYQVCSPWPHLGGPIDNNTNNRVSPFSVNPLGKAQMPINVVGVTNLDQFNSSPVIDSDGILYCFSKNNTVDTNGFIYSYNTKTNKVYPKIDIGATNGDGFTSSPVIDSNGILYCFSSKNFDGNANGSLYSYNTKTKKVYPKIDVGATNGGVFFSSTIIDSNGILYCFSFADNNLNPTSFLYSYNTNTKQVYPKIDIGATNGDQFWSSPVIDSNGILYCFSTNFSNPNANGSLYSYNTNTKHVYPKIDVGATNGDGFTSSAIIDSNGILYCFSANSDRNINGSLYSYNTKTKQVYSKIDVGATNGDGFTSSPVIDSNGILYCFSANNDPNINGSLYSYNTNTKQVYPKIDVGATNGDEFYSSPVIDSNGILYCFSTNNNLNANGSLYSYNTKTKQVYPKINVGAINEDVFISSPVIDSNGTLYCFSSKSYRNTNNQNGSLYSYK